MIAFDTSDPAALLKAFDNAIARGSHEGGITTWEKIGNDYTHASAQWHRKAFLRPHIQTGQLVFNIIKSQSSNVSVTAYGYYHGHLIETFLNHFDRSFSGASCTPLPAFGDLCSLAA
jgi:hypothetical protein